MKKINFEEALKKILAEDTRYGEHAYHFVREALDFTVKLLAKPTEGPARHVSGVELLEGIRQYALQEFGPLAKTVLNRWGVRETADFGKIVFNLVGEGILGKTDEDDLADFVGGYSFEEAFEKPFRPTTPAQPAPADPQQRN